MKSIVRHEQNPFGLTRAQCRCVQAVMEAGSQTEAAAKVGLSKWTINDHISAARLRMRKAGYDASGHMLFVLWDRWNWRGGK